MAKYKPVFEIGAGNLSRFLSNQDVKITRTQVDFAEKTTQWAGQRNLAGCILPTHDHPCFRPLQSENLNFSTI